MMLCRGTAAAKFYYRSGTADGTFANQQILSYHADLLCE